MIKGPELGLKFMNYAGTQLGVQILKPELFAPEPITNMDTVYYYTIIKIMLVSSQNSCVNDLNAMEEALTEHAIISLLWHGAGTSNLTALFCCSIVDRQD